MIEVEFRSAFAEAMSKFLTIRQVSLKSRTITVNTRQLKSFDNYLADNSCLVADYYIGFVGSHSVAVGYYTGFVADNCSVPVSGYSDIADSCFGSCFDIDCIDYLVDHHFNELTIAIKAKDEDNKRVLQACYDLAFFYAYYN